MTFKKFNLDEMVKGWFVGNFDPSVLKTNDVEVGIKHYTKGEIENSHFHKIATEVCNASSRMVGFFSSYYKYWPS